jgi:hypothetical protein
MILNFAQVRFEDDADRIVELGLEEVQPLEPERFQVLISLKAPQKPHM